MAGTTKECFRDAVAEQGQLPHDESFFLQLLKSRQLFAPLIIVLSFQVVIAALFIGGLLV